MAITDVQYVQGGEFKYPPEGSPSQIYKHSMSMAIGYYALDQYGNAKDVPEDTQPHYVHSYYTVTADANEPDMTNRPLTFEGLVQLISTRRARTVETEIGPMAVTIQERNKSLEELGTALGQISAGLKWWGEKDKHSEPWYVDTNLQATLEKYFTEEEMNDIYSVKQDGTKRDANWDEYELQRANARVKAKIDKLNNEAQTDMSRMDTLVSKRDESFSLASDLTSTISDGRTSIINNMG